MNDQLYRAIFDAALDGVVVVDDNMQFVGANPSACAIFGVSQDELPSQNLCNFFPPHLQNESQKLWDEFRVQGQLQGEMILQRADGSEIEVEFRAAAAVTPGRHLSVLRPVGERRKTQHTQQQLLKELESHRLRLQDILASVPGVVWEALGEPDALGQSIGFVSDHVEEMLGYTVQEWLETPNFWLAIVHPDDQEHAARVAAQSFESGSGHTDEFRWIAKDGRVLWVEARAVVVFDEAGKAIGMRGVTTDITPRKEVQKALEWSEERFRLLFEQSPLSTQVLEPGGLTLRVNRAWEELWSARFENLGNYNMLEDQQLIDKGIMPYIKRVFAGEPTAIPDLYYDPRETLDVPGARPRWTRAVAYPITSNGEVSEVVLIHEDITEWKRAERNLTFLLDASVVLASSLEYETTLKNLAEVAVPRFADYCTFDLFEADGIRRVALTHSEPAKAAVIEELERRYPRDDNAPFGPPQVRRTGQPEMMEEIGQDVLEATARDEGHLAAIRTFNLKSYICVPLMAGEQLFGALTWVRTRNSPSYDQQDFELACDLGRRAGIAFDNALLFRKTTDALAAAEAANRAKDEFLAVVSHELRTPLNAISGWASLLRNQKLDAETAEQALETIERNCHVQTKLIEDILEVSRIVGGTLLLEKTSVDLSGVVQAAVGAVRSAAEQKSIRLEAAKQDESLKVDGDEIRLQQVVSNLLSNAIKFTPEGGRVTVTLASTPGEVELRVTDTGQGIAADFLPHVFDRFRQADGSSTRRFGGLGLGLAIVRHLVELHGGSVEAQSPGEGLGATFVVRLSRESQPLPAPEESTEEEETPAAGASAARRLLLNRRLEGREILVVDDEPDARNLARLMLESSGATVATARSAKDALQSVQERTPELVICDIAMPGEDGYTLLRQLRALPDEEKSQVPAVALTAFAGAEERDKALAAGFVEHLSKPIVPADLVNALAALLQK